MIADLKPYPAMKDSDVEWLGDVPEHWEVLPPKRVLRSESSGGAIIKNTAATEARPGYVPAFSASGQDIWLPDASHFGDALVLSAVGARCGRTFRASGEWGVVANTHVLRPLKGQMQHFWWYVTNNQDWWDRAGAAQPFVRVSATLNRAWAVPPLPEQAAIVEYLGQAIADIDSTITRAEREIELLNEYRTRLIADVVTGKLDVRDAAAALPEVDPLAEDDDADELDADLALDAAELDETPEEVEA
jgi:type I restriction enzyme S subunit